MIPVACRNISECLVALNPFLPFFWFLQNVMEYCDGDRAVETRGMLTVTDFNFVLSLSMFSNLLGKIQLVSAQLQSVSIDLLNAVDLVMNLINSLKELRLTDDFIRTLFNVAKNIYLHQDKRIIISLQSYNKCVLSFVCNQRANQYHPPATVK